jgi:hypothetical protein
VSLYPLVEGLVSLVHAVVRTTVHGDGRLAGSSFRCVHLTRRLESVRDLDPEGAHQEPVRGFRKAVDEDVVPVGPEPGPRANEVPHLVQRRSPCRANVAWGDLTPHDG